jgi:hypothetical protein
MRTSVYIVGFAALVAVGVTASRTIGKPAWADQTNAQGQTMLPSGWTVTPAGRHLGLAGDMPLAMGFIGGGTKLAVVTGGWHDQGLSVIDVASEKTVSKMELGNAWAGLATNGDEIFVSGGTKGVRVVKFADGALQRRTIWPRPPREAGSRASQQVTARSFTRTSTAAPSQGSRTAPRRANPSPGIRTESRSRTTARHWR